MNQPATSKRLPPPRNDTDDDLDQYNKLIARQSVFKSGDKFMIKFVKPIKGFNPSKTYDTRETAVTAAYNVLKMQRLKRTLG